MSGALRLFRGIPRVAREPVEQLSGLKAAERPRPAVRAPSKANMRGAVWTSDNPLVASSYAHSGGAVLPLELLGAPDAVLNAKGALWENFFFPYDVKRGRFDHSKLRNAEFAEALADPEVRSIMVQNIIDPGADAMRLVPEDFEGSALQAYDQLFRANNVLVKDPSVLRYLLTGEEAGFKRGGLAQACSCGKHP